MKDVVFVYLGTEVPKYIKPSLLLAREYSGLEVTLIGESSIKEQFSDLDINFVELEKFYERKIFQSAKKNILLDHNFRQGFWLHTLERFFVLEQFMIHDKRLTIFHAELDQLLFGVDYLINSLEKTELKGLFFPFHDDDKAVASVLYCNDIASIKTLTTKAISGPKFANEMELLVQWAHEYPNHFYALPTVKDVLNMHIHKSKEICRNVLASEQLGGAVDAAELGLWIAGRDPRNLALNVRPSNKFTYPVESAALTRLELEEIYFDFLNDKKTLYVRLVDYPNILRVYNLHIQSKIHPWLNSDKSNIQKLFFIANSGKIHYFPDTRLVQISYAISVILNRLREEKFYYIISKLNDMIKILFKSFKFFR